MKRSTLLAGIALVLTSTLVAAQNTAPASAGDPRKGREKTQMCAGCHGIPRWQASFPEVYKVPMIVGQHESYLYKALQQYKSGERNHPTMHAIASTLTDEEMRNLAAYYARGAATTLTAAGKP
jgi:cytochrome c553